jgi:hypothetical protein
LIKRPLAAERAVRGAQPFNGFFLVADHFDSVRVYSCHADRAIRFGRRQKLFRLSWKWRGRASVKITGENA